MDVNVAEPLSHQIVLLYELEDLLVLCPGCQGKKLQEYEDFMHVLEIAASKLANNERMAHHFPIAEESFEVRVPVPKMANPY